MAAAGGIAVRYQGLRRYYALLMTADTVKLVKVLDGETTLAEAPLARTLGLSYALRLQVEGDRLRAWVDGRLLFDVHDAERTLDAGGVALISEEGRVAFDAARVAPVA
jgi:hypothetical protein